VVCDNGSSDGSFERIREWAEGKFVFEPDERSPLRLLSTPPVQKPISFITYERAEAEQGSDSFRQTKLVLIQNGENLGFAGGTNVGLRYALCRGDFDYFWILNNDTAVAGDALSRLVERMEESPEAGICGATLLYYHEPEMVQARGGAVYNKWLGTSRHIGAFARIGGDVARERVERRMSYVVGASMFASRAFLQEVGLLSEEYFLYFEEMDWVARARRKFSLAYAPESLVYHKEGGATGASNCSVWKKSLISDRYMIQNRIKITRKHWPWALPTVYLGLLWTAINRIRRRQWDRVGLVFRAMIGMK
jgi:GT2 family glycosyltransferase